MCSSCGQTYQQGSQPLTITEQGPGSSKGVIKSPARLKAEAEAALAKAGVASPETSNTSVAGTSEPANKPLESSDEK